MYKKTKKTVPSKHTLTAMLLISVLLTIIIVAKYIFESRRSEYIEVLLVGVKNEQQTEFSTVPHWISDALVVGDKELLGNTIVLEILDKSSYEEGPKSFLVLKVKLRVTKNPATGQYKYKQQGISVGSIIEVKTPKVNFLAQVSQFVNDSVNNKEQIIIEGKVYGLRTENAKIIKPGDILSSSSGINREIARVISVESNIGTYIINGGTSNQVVISDNRLRDLDITISVEANKINDKLYFAYIQPIKIGNLLYIPLDNYNLYGLLVTKITYPESYK